MILFGVEDYLGDHGDVAGGPGRQGSDAEARQGSREKLGRVTVRWLGRVAGR